MPISFYVKLIEFRKIKGTYKDTAGVEATSVALISGGQSLPYPNEDEKNIPLLMRNSIISQGGLELL